MPNVEDHDLAGLEAERSRLHAQLASVGDLRRGSLNEAYRRCGKGYCGCAQPDHPGHGPVHLLTKSVGGKTVTRAVPGGPELEKVTREVASYRRFKQIVGQIVEVNEAICETRPVSPLADEGPAAGTRTEKMACEGTPRHERKPSRKPGTRGDPDGNRRRS